MTTRTLWLAAACLGFSSVALGAFGAHALKPMLTAHGRVDTFELAVRYLFYHTFALFIIGYLQGKYEGAVIRWAGWLQLIGVLAFSVSLLLLAVLEWRGMAFITPLGGVLMLAGWGLLIYVIATGKKTV
jgi:uncharacterized membrane protein YgdD (TMEM256/DUF423 family)